jgi:hypothetical protein
MQIGTTQLPAQQQPARMTPQLWIGFGFLVALVAFLIISYFVELKQNSTRRAILQFLTSLTSGFAGASYQAVPFLMRVGHPPPAESRSPGPQDSLSFSLSGLATRNCSRHPG